MDFREINAKIIPAFRESDGHGEFGPVHFDRIVLLTTTGRRTGAPHTVAIGYVLDGDDLILFASNDAAPEDPDWYRNIEADPRVRIEMTGRTFEATARITAGAERDDAHAKWVAFAPHVADHETRSGRTIPMVKVPLA